MTDEELQLAIEAERKTVREANARLEALKAISFERNKAPWEALGLNRSEWNAMKTLQKKGHAVTLKTEG